MVARSGEILLVVARRGERVVFFGVFFTSQRSAVDLLGLRKAEAALFPSVLLPLATAGSEFGLALRVRADSHVESLVTSSRDR
jgi:hypothetical protein